MPDVVTLAAELLAIPSLSSNESGVVDYISRWLIARKWNVTVQEVSKAAETCGRRAPAGV